MKTNIKFGIGAMLAAMLLISMAFAGAADSSKDLQNDPQLQDGKLPDFGPEVFDEMIKSSKVIQTRGTIPKIELENEKREWLHKLDQNGKSIRNQMLPYMQSEGVLVSYGYNYQGYMTVDILEGSEVDETLMDEIYEIFDKQGNIMGIQEVPVVFQFTPQIEMTSRTSTWRPVIGGIRVERSGGTGSTLGFAARKGTQLGYVISGHVAFDAGIGGAIYQPDDSSSNQIGTVDEVYMIFADAGWVEAEMVDVDNSIYYDDTDQLMEVTSEIEPQVGDAVQMSGITSGLSDGFVTDCSHIVSYPGYPRLYDQCRATYTCASGDSGSPVFRETSTYNVGIMGINSGRATDGSYSIFSPISGIYADLGVRPLTS